MKTLAAAVLALNLAAPAACEISTLHRRLIGQAWPYNEAAPLFH